MAVQVQVQVDEAASAELLAAQEGWEHRLAVATDGSPILLTNVDGEPYVLQGIADFAASLAYGEPVLAGWRVVERMFAEVVVEAAMNDMGDVTLIAENGTCIYTLNLEEAVDLLREVREHIEHADAA